MATVDKLIVRIEADMKDLKAKLKSSQTATKNSTAAMEKSFKRVGTSIKGLGRSIFSLKGAIVGLGVGAGIRSLIKVGDSVESLQIRFETIFKSAEEGSKAFEIMAKFASKVPFSLQQIQEGSGSLLAVSKSADDLGKLLKMTGNIAAATGLDFRSASEQIQRSLSAGINAADLFRDRGVTAMLGFTAGVQVSVEDTRIALQKFSDDNDGIMDKLANTFGGTMSMLGDATFSFQRAINDAGFFSELKGHFSDLKTEIDENKEAIGEVAKKVSSTLIGAMQGLRDVLVLVAENFGILIGIFKVFIALKIVMFLANIVAAFKTLNIALVLSTAKQRIFNAAVLKNPYMIAGAALVGVITFINQMSKGLGDAADAQKRLNGATQEGLEAARKLYGEEAVKKIEKKLAALKKEEMLLRAKDPKGTDSYTTPMDSSDEEKAEQLKFNKEVGILLQKRLNLEQEIKNIKSGTQDKDLLANAANDITILNEKHVETVNIMQQLEHASTEYNASLIKAGEEPLAKIQALQDALFATREETMFLAQTQGMSTEAINKNSHAIKEQIKEYFLMLDAMELGEELDKEQIANNTKKNKAIETAKEKIKSLTDANELLNAELLDATETELLQMAMRQANTGATLEQVKALELLIAKNQELKDKIAIKEEDEETKIKKEEDEDQAVLDLVDDLGLLKDAQQDYTDAVARLGTALDEDLISLEQYKNGLHQLKITLLESTEEGKIAIEGLERVQDLLFDNLADALTGAEDGWKGFRDGLKSIVRDIISDLLKLQAQQAMTRMMGGGGSGGGGLSTLLSFGASLFGGAGGGGSVGPSSMGSVGYGQAANGGHINAPTIVGEKGPELFVPHTSGGVFTNRSLKNSGGGGATVNQTINIETGVAQTVRAELQSLMPQIKQETVSAVIDAKKRGGQMADTFA